MVNVQESSYSHKIRRGEAGSIWSLGLALVVAAYCLAWRRYGFELGDEGALLAHIDRVAHGQVPYRDFHVGYGPALYWLYAASFGWWGASTGTVRVILALAHGVRALVLARVAYALGGRGWATAAVLVLVAFFLPVAPGLSVPGNIPYPAWFADAVGLVALVLLVRWPGATLLVGGLWGVVFAFKQNSGLLGLGAAALTVVLAAPTTDGGGRAVGVALAVGLLVAATTLLWPHLGPVLVLVFLLPLVPLAAATARTRVTAATWRALLALAVGFLVVAGGVVTTMMVRAGVGPVATDLLQVGTDTVVTYYVPYPSPATVLGEAAGAPWLRAMRLVGDGAWFAVFPLAHLLGAVLVATGRIRSRLGVAVVVLASLGYLQLYPRMDFWHVLALAPASLAVVTLDAGALGARGRRAFLAILLLIAVVRFAPTLPVLATLTSREPPGPRMPRIDVRWDLVRDEAVRHLPELVEAVELEPRVAGFPALGAVNFALGRPSPWRHDYFFPGRPTAAEEQEMAAAIVRDPPDAVVVLEATPGSFARAFESHATILAALERSMEEGKRIGPYRVLVPRTEQ